MVGSSAYIPPLSGPPFTSSNRKSQKTSLKHNGDLIILKKNVLPPTPSKNILPPTPSHLTCGVLSARNGYIYIFETVLNCDKNRFIEYRIFSVVGRRLARGGGGEERKKETIPAELRPPFLGVVDLEEANLTCVDLWDRGTTNGKAIQQILSQNQASFPINPRSRQRQRALNRHCMQRLWTWSVICRKAVVTPPVPYLLPRA